LLTPLLAKYGAIELQTTKLSVETCCKNGKDEFTVMQSLDGTAHGRKFHVDHQTLSWVESEDAFLRRVNDERRLQASKRDRGEHEEEAEEEDGRQSLPSKRVSPPRPTFAETSGLEFGAGFDCSAPSKFHFGL
jgi:hypothetical protein